jgi:hypothetical protein
MSISRLESMVKGYTVVGSIVHAAYGDYYEQMICLRKLKRLHPELHLVLFFASESRLKELAVFDLSFADEVHHVNRICDVPVEKFLQFQVHDGELNEEVFAALPKDVLAKFDFTHNLKPWEFVRSMYRESIMDCDLPLSPLGFERLPQCFKENGLDESTFPDNFTVGFLWRYRNTRGWGGISSFMQTPEDQVHDEKSALFSTLAEKYGARIIIAGMDLRLTEENRVRTDCKFSERRLAVRNDACVYLKGLNWGLELEIMRRCTLCIVMASGFSEALLMKRDGPTVLVDPPVHYLAKLLWNGMPLFNAWNIHNLAFYLQQPHTAKRVLKHLDARKLIGREFAPAPALAEMAK